jgi:hypothetical protein
VLQPWAGLPFAPSIFTTGSLKKMAGACEMELVGMAAGNRANTALAMQTSDSDAEPNSTATTFENDALAAANGSSGEVDETHAVYYT